MADSSSTSSSSAGAVLRRLLPRLALLALILVVADQGLGFVLSRMHRATRAGAFGGKVNLVLEQRAEVFVFGGSRAEHHYVPSVIEPLLSKTVFNAGFAAQTAMFHYGLLELLLEQHEPELIVLDINAIDLDPAQRATALARLTVLLPYDENPHVRRLLLERGPFEPLKLLSGLYRHNSQILPLLAETLRPGRSAGEEGYVALHESALPELLRVARERPWSGPTEPEADDEWVRAFLDAAQRHGVRVIAVCSPRWATGPLAPRPMEEHLKHEYHAILTEYGVPLVDMSPTNYPIFADPQLYKDETHLVDEGARLFSRVGAERLAELLGCGPGAVAKPR